MLQTPDAFGGVCNLSSCQQDAGLRQVGLAIGMHAKHGRAVDEAPRLLFHTVIRAHDLRTSWCVKVSSNADV